MYIYYKQLQSEAEGAGAVDVGRRGRVLHEEGGGLVRVGRQRRAGGVQRGVPSAHEPSRDGRQNEELFQESQFALVVMKLIEFSELFNSGLPKNLVTCKNLEFDDLG